MATIKQLQAQIDALQAALADSAPAEKRPVAPRPWDARRVKIVKGCFTHTLKDRIVKGETVRGATNKYRALSEEQAIAAIKIAYLHDYVYAERA
jgi:hypothetical protein